MSVESDIAVLGRCTACFKSKRSTKYCRLIKHHRGEKAAPCPSCFEVGFSVSDCRLTHSHCGPGVTAALNVVNMNVLSKVNRGTPQRGHACLRAGIVFGIMHIQQVMTARRALSRLASH